MGRPGRGGDGAGALGVGRPGQTGQGRQLDPGGQARRSGRRDSGAWGTVPFTVRRTARAAAVSIRPWTGLLRLNPGTNPLSGHGPGFGICAIGHHRQRTTQLPTRRACGGEGEFPRILGLSSLDVLEEGAVMGRPGLEPQGPLSMAPQGATNWSVGGCGLSKEIWHLKR